jgi:hypothetical protein
MPRQNGWVYLRAKVRKSTACGATVVPAEGGFNPDQGVTIQASAPEKTIKFPSGSSNAEGFWELKTSPDNLHAGRVDATVSIADSEGCVAVEWLRNTFVDVD